MEALTFIAGYLGQSGPLTLGSILRWTADDPRFSMGSCFLDGEPLGALVHLFVILGPPLQQTLLQGQWALLRTCLFPRLRTQAQFATTLGFLEDCGQWPRCAPVNVYQQECHLPSIHPAFGRLLLAHQN